MSFGFKGIPSDQHFTFAKNDKSGINFHITKNIADPKNSLKKPFIPILEIDKKIISSDLNSLFLSMFFVMLNEIDISEIEGEQETTFLSFDDLDKDMPYGKNEKEFFKNFEGVSKITRKTRLKVNEGWVDKLVELTQSKKMVDLITQKTKKIQNVQLKEIDGGVLLSGEKVLYAIKIYDKWFELSIDKKPIEMFKQVIGERLAKIIWYNIRRAIIILKTVDSWRDTENKYKPITIIKNEEKPVAKNV